MKHTSYTRYIWIFSVLFTLFFVYYQRKTGPTYPVTVKIKINQQTVKNKLIRTAESGENATIRIYVPDSMIDGFLQYKRYKSYDEWHEVKMVRDANDLVAFIPDQPPAGKVMYLVILEQNMHRTSLTQEPVIMRFKGPVPLWILIIHVLVIFIAMLFSARTGVEAVLNRPKVISLTRWTIILLFIGGLILGPVVQKYAFGDFWTGWPIGNDLTDNKMAIAFIFWLIAFIQQLRTRKSNRVWVILAAVVLIVIFLIPHSMWGSEIDHTRQ